VGSLVQIRLAAKFIFLLPSDNNKVVSGFLFPVSELVKFMVFGLGPTEIILILLFVFISVLPLLILLYALWYFFIRKKPEEKIEKEEKT